jgi:hypothetical protein
MAKPKPDVRTAQSSSASSPVIIDRSHLFAIIKQTAELAINSGGGRVQASSWPTHRRPSQARQRKATSRPPASRRSFLQIQHTRLRAGGFLQQPCTRYIKDTLRRPLNLGIKFEKNRNWTQQGAPSAISPLTPDHVQRQRLGLQPRRSQLNIWLRWYAGRSSYLLEMIRRSLTQIGERQNIQALSSSKVPRS